MARTPLPDESKPQYYKDTEASKKVQESLTDPKLPTAGTQSYTQQQLQSGELQSNVNMGAPTTVGARQISAPLGGVAANTQTSTIATPSAIQSGTYTANTSGGPATITGAQATGLSKQVQAQTGTASQATAATDTGAMAGTMAGNVVGNLSPASIVANVTGTTPDEALMSKQVEELLKTTGDDKVPIWAKPALEAAEGVLAARGMGKSTVAREAIMSAIIQSALPIAQENAKTQQATFMQNLSNKQQAAVQNAQASLGMDMANLSYSQQQAISNSKFMQTLQLSNLSNKQQTTLQNAVNMSQMNLANLSNNQQAQVANAQSFLQMDMSNLSNAQQATMMNGQNAQQNMLSDQAAINASLQFNAANQQQTNTFMSNLKTQVDSNNAARSDATNQFNTSLAQQRAALDSANSMQAQQLTAQMNAQIDQFNSQLGFNANQFNVQNQNAINQSNTTWRRQLNTANTAGENSVNQANAMNAFNMSNQALTMMWQEQRDAADWATKMAMTDEDSKTRLAIAALGNEAATDASKKDSIMSLGKLAVDLFNSWQANQG